MIENHLATNTTSFSIMWRIFYNYIFFKRFYFCYMIFLNYVADFFTTTSSSKGSILVTRYFSIYNYIIFRMFYFGNKIFLNHVADFLQLHLFQNVQFLWQDLSQSCGGFSAATSSSECSILVTSKLSTILGINQVIHHFRNLEWVIHHFGNLSKGYPPV